MWSQDSLSFFLSVDEYSLSLSSAFEKFGDAQVHYSGILGSSYCLDKSNGAGESIGGRGLWRCNGWRSDSDREDEQDSSVGICAEPNFFGRFDCAGHEQIAETSGVSLRQSSEGYNSLFRHHDAPAGRVTYTRIWEGNAISEIATEDVKEFSPSVRWQFDIWPALNTVYIPVYQSPCRLPVIGVACRKTILEIPVLTKKLPQRPRDFGHLCDQDAYVDTVIKVDRTSVGLPPHT